MFIYEDIVTQVAKLEADRAAKKAIRYLRSLRGDSRLSGEDSGLRDAWDEVCVQVQNGYSIFWDAYVLTAKQAIDGATCDLPSHLRLAMWLQSTEAADWEEYSDEDSTASEPPVTDHGIIDYVFDEHLIPMAQDYSNARITRYLEREAYID